MFYRLIKYSKLEYLRLALKNERITKEIKIMDSEKIKKYWYEEFN